MKQELDEALVRDFPYLFADRHSDMRTTAMCWGFECSDGWEPIIRELAEKLEPICKSEAEKMIDEDKKLYGWPRASQVKEKYAGLRFYMTSATEDMCKYIQEAEEKSEVTCETCGEPGEIRGRGWLYTACFEHTRDEHKSVLEIADSFMEENKELFQDLAKLEELEKKK